MCVCLFARTHVVSLSNVCTLNTTRYQLAHGDRAGLRAATKGWTLHNSEYGDGDGSGLSMVAALNTDFFELVPQQWAYWQVLDEAPGWGLLAMDPAGGAVGKANRKHFMLCQYTRHLKVGMEVLRTSHHDTVAAYDPGARTLVLITTAFGPGREVAHDLVGFAAVGGPVRRWQSGANDGGDRYVEYGDDGGGEDGSSGAKDDDQGRVVRVDHSGGGAIVRVWCPANTTVTLEVYNVVR